MAHARLSASAAHRWLVCPGSVNLSADLPNKSSEHAALGTLAHDIAAYCLDLNVRPQAFLGKTRTIDGYKVTVDQEMVDGVQFYLDTLADGAKKGDQDFVEVDLTEALQKIDPDLGGTADHVRWRPKAKHLKVTDLKYGAGKVVEPTDNPQLKLYALGALLSVDKPAETVTVTIVQPRIEHEDGRVRDWTFKAVELLDFAADVADAATRTREVNAALVPGDAQCQWCPARRTCPELEAKQHALIAAEFKDLVPYDPQALGKALDLIPLVEARIKALREFAYEEAMRGAEIPGHKLVAKRATRQWLDPKAVADWAEARGIDPYEEPKIKSPAQMEKGLKKPEKDAIADMVVSVSSGFALVPESDKRPPARLALAAEFAVIEESSQ